jgi:hypothetical protein
MVRAKGVDTLCHFGTYSRMRNEERNRGSRRRRGGGGPGLGRERRAEILFDGVEGVLLLCRRLLSRVAEGLAR